MRSRDDAPKQSRARDSRWLGPEELLAILTATTVGFVGMCVIAIYFAGRYQGTPFDQTLLFAIADHPPLDRPISTYSVGRAAHVFGDFVVVYEGALREPFSPFVSPTGIELPYSPTLMLLFKAPFSVGPYKLHLIVFLVASLALLALPAAWATRSQAWASRVTIVILFGILPFPVLMALDRGNIQSLLVPVLFAAALAMERERWSRASWAVAIAASMKFYSAVIAVPLLLARRFGLIVQAAFVALAITFVGLLLVDGSIGQATSAYWRVTVDGHWSGRMAESDFSSFLWFNWSLAGGIGRIFELGHFQHGMDLIARYPQAIGVVFIGFVILTLAAGGRFLPSWLRSFMYLSPISLAAPISTGYTLAWIVIPIAFAIRNPSPRPRGKGERPDAHLVTMPTWLQALLAVALASVAAIKPTWSGLTAQLFPVTESWVNTASLIDPLIMGLMALVVGTWCLIAHTRTRGSASSRNQTENLVKEIA